jgi:type II secretory pathway component PulF
MPVEINLIKAAEASGTLTTVLRRIVTFRERQAMLTRRVISALLYPCVLVLACGVVLFIIAKVVVPEFKSLFDRLGVNTPPATKLFFDTVEFLTSMPFVITFFAAIIGAFALYKLWVNRLGGRRTADYLKLRIPWIGKHIVQKYAVIEMTRSLSLMLRSGLSMLVTLDLVRSVVTNQAVAGVMQRIRDAVERGEGIEAPLRQNEHLVPLIVTDMLVTGEEAGQIDQIAEHIAETYEEELAIDLDSLGEIVQPAVTIAIGMLVALLFAALFQPMVDMMTQLNAQGGA